MTMTGTNNDVLTSVLITRWNSASKKFLDLAAEIPDERLESQMVRNARTSGEVLRHVAYWNRYVADSLHGRKADDSANELPREDFPNKAGVLKDLEKTSRDIADGIGRSQDEKALGLMFMALEHMSEHYGQLAVYARTQGIVPPASRG